MVLTSTVFLLKKIPERKKWPKIRQERGGVSYATATGKDPAMLLRLASF
jgi:hypothetical protein